MQDWVALRRCFKKSCVEEGSLLECRVDLQRQADRAVDLIKGWLDMTVRSRPLVERTTGTPLELGRWRRTSFQERAQTR